MSVCMVWEQIAQQARQLLAACEKGPTDAVQLNYDARNPFDLRSITFTPIYRCAPARLFVESTQETR